MHTFALLLLIKLAVSFWGQFPGSYQPCEPGDVHCANRNLRRTNQALIQAVQSLNSHVHRCKTDSDCAADYSCYRTPFDGGLGDCMKHGNYGSSYDSDGYGCKTNSDCGADEYCYRTPSGGDCIVNGRLGMTAGGRNYFAGERLFSQEAAVGAFYGQDACPPNSPSEVNKYFLEYSKWQGPGNDPSMAKWILHYKAGKRYSIAGKDFMWTNADYVSFWNADHNPVIESAIDSVTSIPRTNWISVGDMIGCPNQIEGLLEEGKNRYRVHSGTGKLPSFQCFHFPKNVYGCEGGCATVKYVHLHSMGPIVGNHLVDHNLPTAGCDNPTNHKYLESGACIMCQGQGCYGICVVGDRDSEANANSIVAVLRAHQ